MESEIEEEVGSKGLGSLELLLIIQGENTGVSTLIWKEEDEDKD